MALTIGLCVGILLPRHHKHVDQDMNTNIGKQTQKISVKVWRPIIEKFELKMTSACLRRDAYLCRVLEGELDQLDKEVTEANSEAAKSFVVSKLDQLPDRKLVSITLRPDLIERLNQICNAKQIVRDAFLNRLLLLLSASPVTFDRLLNLDDGWKRQLLHEYRYETFFENSFYPIEEQIDPFWAVRDWLSTESGTPPAADEGIYTLFFGNNKFKDIDLSGLNCYVPDWRIPDHPAEIERRKYLDEMLVLL